MDRSNRMLASAGIVLAAVLGSWAIARGAAKPFSPDAPDFRRQGPADAPIVIVEFSDFECPACRFAEAPLRAILEAHKGKVRLVFKHFPLERMHRFARPGAIAAECAGKQGKFWEYHHALYDKQGEWPVEGKSEDLLTSYAKGLKLDVPAWQACRKDPASDAAVSSDAKDGDRAWVGSTPTFFVNGKRFVGGKDLHERGSWHIEKELKKLK